MKIIIKIKILLFLLFLIAPGFINTVAAQQTFEKAAFYNVMSSGDIDAVTNELSIVRSSSINNKEGYEGALLMRQAGLVSRPKKKLDLFKEGRIKLETAIQADADYTEFHFLRLAVEEHAPKIVKYHADIETDKAIVIKNFKTLSPAVQHAILDYCKNSKLLRAEDL
jgi:hypothetical protein